MILIIKGDRTGSIGKSPGQPQSATQLELPGVFRNIDTLQKFLLGFIIDLEDPDKADDDYINWLSEVKKGNVEKDEKKTISDM